MKICTEVRKNYTEAIEQKSKYIPSLFHPVKSFYFSKRDYYFSKKVS